MNRLAVAIVALVIIGAFAALTVSVVDVRRPLDRNVSRSFDRTVVKLPAVLESRGCKKARAYYYNCTAGVREPRRRPAVAVWRLFLRDNGCWLTIRPSEPARATTSDLVAAHLGPLQGCTG